MWEARLGTASGQGSAYPAFHALPTYGLAITLALAPTTAVFFPRTLAPLFVLAVLCALPALRHPQNLRWPPRSLLWGLAAFHLWQLISILWCLDPAQALHSTAGMAGLSLGGVILLTVTRDLSEKSLRLVLRAAIMGLLAGGIVFTVEAIWGIAIRQALYPALMGKDFTQILFPQRLNRASTVLALLILPVGYGLIVQRRWAILAASIAATGLAVMLSPSSTAKICLVLGPLIALTARAAVRPVSLAIKAVLTVLILAIPFAIAALPDTQTLWNRVPAIPSSAHHRLTIWKFSADRVMEKPVLGWGMDASRDIPGGEDQLFVTPPPGRGEPHHEQMLPLHPHNTALQWWLELGAVGAVLGLAVMLTLVSLLRRLPRPHGALALGTLVQGVTVSFISFGAWQSWWGAVLWLLAALLAILARLYPRGELQSP